ncbi:hypothetical protein [Pseudoalteromonas luteoviolacea]|uniref:Uncharacterized protein n=1 Tax=Pseudoalteromonas luteoviolacea NCIMB 1942 TaxID=1365253 RepID=A0A167BMQ8_9GAMM|nr:hypothetical protein [Pseudoalteromonas luteoviolacea]KZN46708.1 hypothetical protein N482_11570 [Pseudoalteromonas luteoviolacea NCIMB 1942]
MKQLEILDEEHMSWLLFRCGDEHFISVIAGTVGVFTLEVKLSNTEASIYARNGKKYIDELADSIRYNPKHFESRCIKGFRQAYDVQSALIEWREHK